MKAIILGVDGKTLTEEEKSFFAEVKPAGFILFARNIESKAQVKALVESLRASVNNPNAPVLVDQEGGRVCRFKKSIWYCPKPAVVFGKIAQTNLTDAKRAVELSFTLVAFDMIELGVNVDAVPILDVPSIDAHDVIGDRAFSSDPFVVAELGQVVCDTFSKYGLVSILKHIPGHGRAKADSHKDLPVVDAEYELLDAVDFYPFKQLSSANLSWAMTAHVCYQAIDSQNPATFSKKVIEDEIRGTIGFNGLLITDCITMDALMGSMSDRAKRSIEAGCDIVLHSRFKNGSIAELQEVVANVPTLNERQLQLMNATSVPIVKVYSMEAIKLELDGIYNRYNITDDNLKSSIDPTERPLNHSDEF